MTAILPYRLLASGLLTTQAKRALEGPLAGTKRKLYVRLATNNLVSKIRKKGKGPFIRFSTFAGSASLNYSSLVSAET